MDSLFLTLSWLGKLTPSIRKLCVARNSFAAPGGWGQQERTYRFHMEMSLASHDLEDFVFHLNVLKHTNICCYNGFYQRVS